MPRPATIIFAREIEDGTDNVNRLGQRIHNDPHNTARVWLRVHPNPNPEYGVEWVEVHPSFVAYQSFGVVTFVPWDRVHAVEIEAERWT